MSRSADPAGTLARAIAADGPIGLDRFMEVANDHYYATRDPFGPAGDFITAPEISQMFGELIGLALADLWARGGQHSACYVELGPGRGTLALDAQRALAKAGLALPTHFVERSPLLRAAQRERLPDATWHENIDTLPRDRALLIVANEFFDALPIRQFMRTTGGWRERLVDRGPQGFMPVTGDTPCDRLVPPHLLESAIGSIVERAPAAAAIARQLGERLAHQGGALLAIDYGHDGGHAGDTLQAVRRHGYADIFTDAGENDLTAHVDFSALADALAQGGARTLGPVPQGQWLMTLGLAHRAAALVRAVPAREQAVTAAYRRLTQRDAMGERFKVLGAVPPGWPALAGFG